MIVLEAVTKFVGKREVLSGVNARLPSNRRIGVLGPRSDEKKLLIEMLGGVVLPSSGRIIRNARVGLPPGHMGGFLPDLPVKLNVAHVARLYGAHVDTIVSFVNEVCQLGDDFNRPLKALSNAQKRHLVDVLAFTVPFDVYLVREDLLRTGGKWYDKGVGSLFEARAKTSGMVITSENNDFIREFCDAAFYMSEGQARFFRNVEQAISYAEKNITAEQKEKNDRRAERIKERQRRAALDAPND